MALKPARRSSSLAKSLSTHKFRDTREIVIYRRADVAASRMNRTVAVARPIMYESIPSRRRR